MPCIFASDQARAATLAGVIIVLATHQTCIGQRADVSAVTPTLAAPPLALHSPTLARPPRLLSRCHQQLTAATRSAPCSQGWEPRRH